MNEKLQSEAQRQAAEWIRDLSEDEDPSLAWRAALNERLRAEAARKARGRWRWNVARPAMGLALAASLAAVLFVPRAVTPERPVGSRLEASLVALHQDAVRTADIVGTGVRPSEAPVAPTLGPDPLEDLDTL